MVLFERALVTSYRLSIVTFPLPLRVSEILPLLCPSTLLFPTLPLSSPKFPHVPLGLGGWPLGYKERRCWLIVRAISFQDFQLMWSWSTNVTDRQTDRRHAISIVNTALCTIVHRAVTTQLHRADQISYVLVYSNFQWYAQNHLALYIFTTFGHHNTLTHVQETYPSRLALETYDS